MPATSLGALSAFHAVKGIGRIRRWSDDVSSFTLSLRSVQYQHYGSIVDHLAADGGDQSTRAFRRLFLTKYRHERTLTY